MTSYSRVAQQRISAPVLVSSHHAGLSEGNGAVQLQTHIEKQVADLRDELEPASGEQGEFSTAAIT